MKKIMMTNIMFQKIHKKTEVKNIKIFLYRSFPNKNYYFKIENINPCTLFLLIGIIACVNSRTSKEIWSVSKPFCIFQFHTLLCENSIKIHQKFGEFGNTYINKNKNKIVCVIEFG